MPKASALFAKLKRHLVKLGQKPVLDMLAMYYLAKDKTTPAWVVAIITGCLAYFVMPIDGIADFLPLGFTDDLALLAASYAKVKQYVTDEHRAKAKARYQQWFTKA